MGGQIPQEMAKLTIKKKIAAGKAPAAPAAPDAPSRAVAMAKGINWAYYIVPPLLIIAVFQYCRTHAHRAAAPAQPAAATAPAVPAAPTAEPAPAAVETPAVEPAADDSDFAPETEQPQEEK